MSKCIIRMRTTKQSIQKGGDYWNPVVPHKPYWPSEKEYAMEFTSEEKAQEQVDRLKRIASAENELKPTIEYI